MKQVFLTLEIIYDSEKETLSYNLEGQEDTPLHIVQEVLTDVITELHTKVQSKPELTLKDIHDQS